MGWQEIGALGEVVGGVGVVLSLIYVAYQIRQSSRQIELNSRHIEASMYATANDAFSRWQALLAADEALADLWLRALRGEELSDGRDLVRFTALCQILFNAYENNFVQLRLGTVRRDTFGIQRALIKRMLSQPAFEWWWKRRAPFTLSTEFRAAIDALVAEPSDPIVGAPERGPAPGA